MWLTQRCRCGAVSLMSVAWTRVAVLLLVLAGVSFVADVISPVTPPPNADFATRFLVSFFCLLTWENREYGAPFASLILASSPEAAHIPLAIFLVFGTAKLCSDILERLNQPGIVGEILAGILIGPSVLGRVKPTDFIIALAELGVIFLLFRVGLEGRSSELMKVGATALLVAMPGSQFPFSWDGGWP